MTDSVYITDSGIIDHGHGGGVVSFHELNALKQVTDVKHVYQHLGKLLVESEYPHNPFMLDYYYASLLHKLEEVDVAQFYGAGFSLTMKMLTKAKKIVTCAAHDLDVSLEEWINFKVIEPPPAHLTNPHLFSLLCKGLTDESDIVVCPSTSSAEFLKRKFKLENIKIIPHGTYLPDKWSENRIGFTVFHLSQFGPDKGVKYLSEAWDFLYIKPCKLIIAGNEQTYRFNPKSSSLQCVGYLSEESKNTLYAKSSVYVQPSVTEGFGLPPLEAMAYGTPVIVTEGVGMKDLVEDGKDGFIVPIRDPEAIAKKMLYLYENPGEREKMGRNAREKAEQYSWEIIEGKYVELIREVTG